MGRHRALANQFRRGVARWPIAVVILIVFLALCWFGWTWVQDTLDRRAEAEAQGCREGTSTLRLAVSPSVSKPVQQAADRWNNRNVVVYDHCVHVDVAAIPSDQVFAGLTGEWNDKTLGGRPQAWLPESSFWVNRLAATNNALLGSTPESVASSPVVLAVPQDAAQQLTDAGSFEWGNLASLVSDPDGWSKFNKPEWGRFSVAIPDPSTNPASVLAVQGALAGVSPQPAAPVTTQTLTQPAVQQALTALAAARPDNLPNTTQDALIALASASDVRTAPFSAVPVTEVDLYRRNLGTDGKPAGRPLFEVAARGPSPAADFPFVGLAGDGVDETQVRAAQRFGEFLKETDQQRDFNQAGLRTARGADYPRDAVGIRWDTATTSLVPADANTTQQISASWASAADGGQVVTVLVDVSDAMAADGGDGRSRMDWVKDALNGQADRTVSGSIGLWEFSRTYKQLVQTKPVDDQRTVLHAAVNSLKPDSSSYLYTSLAAVYQSTMDDYVNGKRNRIVVITAAPNDGGFSIDQLRDQLNTLTDPNRKLSVSVIAIGPEPNAKELRDITRSTGGSFSVLTEANGVDAALGQLLSVAG